MTSKTKQVDNLIGQLLIASPSLNDPNFHQTVTYICENNESGSFGLIINRPMETNISEILNQLNLGSSNELGNCPGLQGGPVGLERGFVLHKEGEWENTSKINQDVSITTSKDILLSMASGAGPSESLLILGYAGWGSGQLEQELQTNSWINVPANEDILFTVPYTKRWDEAINLLGIDASNISGPVSYTHLRAHET